MAFVAFNSFQKMAASKLRSGGGNPFKQSVPTRYTYVQSYFTFNDSVDSTTVVDSISGYNGTNNNSVTLGAVGIDGIGANTCASFNGTTTQFLSIPASAFNKMNVSATICFWFQPSTVSSIVFAKMFPVTLSLCCNFGVGCVLSSSSTTPTITTAANQFIFRGGLSRSYMTLGTTITTGKWYHIAISYGSSNCMYVDGSVLVNNGGYSITINTGDTTPVVIGGAYNSATGIMTKPFSGSIQNLSTWTTQLDANDILNIYQNHL
jgi:hypothetical protein